MDLLTIQVGALSTNCYVLVPGSSGECAVIDPGGEGERIINDVRSRGLTARYVLSTHGHADHTGAAATVLGSLGGEYGLGTGDVEMALDPPFWLTALLPDFMTPPRPALELSGDELLPLGPGELEVIATPGHTPGSMCFRYEDVVFTGDTLFKGSIGRYDLPGGNGELELESIRDRLMSMNDDVQVLPGHGPASTIGDERRTNPYLT
ncbi:MAG: MBL fold metallo-hydrolase [Dehalococcoidia bacterium]